MKKIIVNIMATTALAVILLAAFVRILLPGYDLYFTSAVFQIFSANIVIHFGLVLIRKLESKYLVLDVLLDIVYTATVLIVFGVIFDWLVITPVWILMAMATLIYLVLFFFDMVRIRKEAKIINKLLKDRTTNKGQHKKENLHEL